ncbi:MAG: hypothetical protein AAFR76_04620 [Planctomycetota bacterium]
MNQSNDPQIEAMLDELGARTRAEPDGGFEQRVEQSLGQPVPTISGRRRIRRAPVWLGAVAATVAVGVVLWPATRAVSPGELDGTEAAAESIAELSFTLFDDAFGLEDSLAFADDTSSTFDPTSLDEWFTEGEPL